MAVDFSAVALVLRGDGEHHTGQEADAVARLHLSSGEDTVLGRKE